ncbi:MAG: SDR family NAD(P)-dependent oxidoreductase, partial [Gammaproteobacteria bacterium]|nr:SDR family NAD(P)-dependent oxidoreductase [Gammaproteobacteria bacterium]
MIAHSLDHQVALITGAASGIGKQIAETFAQAGATVIIADLNLAAAERTAQEIIQAGGQALAIAMNVCDEEAVNQGIETVMAHFKKIDILVSNAGVQHIE